MEVRSLMQSRRSLIIMTFAMVLSVGIAFGFSKARRPAAEELAEELVWVVQPDGQKSCEPGSGKALGDAATALENAKIPIRGSRKGNDGMAHLTVCGAGTGSLNAYQIPKKDLERATKLGFRESTQEMIFE